jgi:hypothetical protein
MGLLENASWTYAVSSSLRLPLFIVRSVRRERRMSEQASGRHSPFRCLTQASAIKKHPGAGWWTFGEAGITFSCILATRILSANDSHARYHVPSCRTSSTLTSASATLITVSMFPSHYLNKDRRTTFHFVHTSGSAPTRSATPMTRNPRPSQRFILLFQTAPLDPPGT